MVSPSCLAVTLALLANSASVAFAQVDTAAAGNAHEAYADVPGARLFYIDTGGTGVPVVFLHAATGSSRVWQHQIPAFAAAGYRFIAYDRRGWGRTLTDPAGPVGTGADDLLALLDRLKVRRVHLVATAAGGFVALDFAVAFPDRLRSLVVADSIGGLQDREVLDLERRIRPPQFDALPPEVRELGPTYRAANPEGTRLWADLEKTSRPSGPLTTSTLELSYSLPMRNQLTLSLLEQIRVPTLLVSGGADMTTPPPLMRLLASRIKNVEFLVVPQAGHSVYWEEPETFNRAVLGFIRKH